jgi:membrane fusion protein (multidrug efflux system)
VKQGDVLVEMGRDEERALLDEARAAAEEAKRQLDRLTALAGTGVAAKSLLDERQREYDTPQARLAAIESRLRDRIIVAPFDGVVGLRNISVGTLVEPGTLITTLNDDSRMKLDFTVPSVYLPALRPGLPIVAMARALPDQVFEGEIFSIDNQIDPITRSITVRAILPNDRGLLKQGLLMSVELMKNPRDAVVIAEEALIPEARKNFVLVVQDKDGTTVAERREVQIGARRAGEVEVLAGLQPGEKVVTHGTTRARPGQAVSVTAVATGSESLQQLLSTHKTAVAGAN